MIPILYEGTETSFLSNGIARLRDCIACEVTEERNGVYECDFSYPIDGAHFDDITPGRIIAVTHDETGDVQPFDIVSYTKPIDGVAAFHAVHVSYRQSFMTVAGQNINSLADALELIKDAEPENPFHYETDMESSAYFAAADGTPRTVRQLIGGTEGSILDTYGGELEWDKFTVKLHRNRGQTRDLTVRYGINMTDYYDDTDYLGAYTSCVPYWNGEGGPIIGSKIDSGLPSYNGREACIPLDLTDKFEDAPTVSELESAALSYMSSKQSNMPSQNIRIDFLRLQDFSGYEDFEDLLECNLCDTITVVYPKYGTAGQYKIVRTIWDVLEGRYLEMELGDLKTSLAEALGVHSGGSSSSYSSGVQSDWNVTDSSSPAYIANKPTIPSKTSDLTNDSGFITSSVSGKMIPYGYCETAKATTAKTVTVSPAITELTTGLMIAVKFKNTNTVTDPTLTVNGLGPVAIKRYGTTAVSTSTASSWNANSVVILTYDGTNWQLTDFNNSTYSGMTVSEYTAGSSTTNRLISPTNLKGAIQHWAPQSTISYENLTDKPSIEGTVLSGDKSFEDLDLLSLTNTEIEDLINSVI